MMLATQRGTRGLVIRGEPLDWAEELSRKMVKVERTMDGALLLDADPSWAWAINLVLVSKGVRVNELLAGSPLHSPEPFRGTELLG